MKRMNFSFLMIFLPIILFLTACQSRPATGECNPNKESPLSGSWTVESTLPIEAHTFSIVTHSSDEIWLATDEKLLRYRKSTRTWDEFSMIGEQNIAPHFLYESKYRTLWGFILRTYEFTEIELKRPTLVRYDENGQFEVIRDRDRIFNNGLGVWVITEPANNPEGLLWMLGEEEINNDEMMTSLISLDPTTLQAVRHLSQITHRRVPATPESSFSDIAIPPDGKIWLADRGLGQLVYFDPATGTSNRFDAYPGASNGIPYEVLRDIYYLYVDREGRLWIDDRGYLDFSDLKNPSWHEVFRSPVFFSDLEPPEMRTIWSKPYQIYQSSNGVFWLSFAKEGMVKLYPETGDWCRFSTRASPIAEDGQGNLWIAVFGKLYRNHVAP